mgnify:CR=1 FL=1
MPTPVASSRRSSHSAASMRRRRKVCDGQLGLARYECAIALDRGAVVVAAQDEPFRELSARPDPISPPAACVASAGLCLRTSSMTFSSASLSACEVDDVAATAAGAGRLARARRQGGMLARRRGQRARRIAAAAVAGAAAAGRGGGIRRRPSRSHSRLYSAVAGNDVAGDRPRLRQRNFRLGPGIRRQCRQSDRQRQARRQCGRSQCGCAGGWGHGVPSRRIIQSLKP